MDHVEFVEMTFFNMFTEALHDKIMCIYRKLFIATRQKKCTQVNVLFKIAKKFMNLRRP